MITLSVILFKKLRTLTFELVVLQSVSEMIFNLSIIAFYNPPVHGNWQCKFQGWLIDYGIMSSIFFSGAIAAHMYYTITKRNYHLTPKVFYILAGVVVVVSAGIAALPFATNQYDDLGAQCWIVAQGEYGTTVRNGVIMRFLTHYGIIWMVCIYCAWSYVTVIRYVVETKRSLRTSSVNSRTDVERTIFRLQYYPGII
jgi:ABC-type Fe3+-siderophore transport system permease subunit